MKQKIKEINKWLELKGVDCRVYTEGGFFEIEGKEYFATYYNACGVVQEIGFYMMSKLAKRVDGYAYIDNEKGASIIKLAVDKKIFATVEVTCLGIFGNPSIAEVLNGIVEIFVPSKKLEVEIKISL